MKHDALTLGRWPHDVARTDPDKVAIVDRGTRVGYGELECRASALAQRLREAGCGVGTRIATLSGSTAEQVVLLFACAKIGAVLAPLSWRLSPTELAGQLRVCDPAILVVEAAFDELGRAARESLGIVSTSFADIEEAVPPVAAPGEQRSVRDEDPLLMIFTSGSTGVPKAVALTHANCTWANLALARATPMQSRDVVLQVLPQFHIAGWNIQPLLAWWTGATVVLERTFDASRALLLIERHRVTTFMGVPAVFRELTRHPDFERRELATLETVVVGGGVLDTSTLARLTGRGVHPLQGYGLTEAGPNVTIDLTGCHGTSIGKPYPGVDVAVLAGDRIESGPATGELLVRAPAVFPGYFRNEEATAAAFVDSWLRSGDLVESDPDGTIHILDRIKDIVRSGGETIAPLEVEQALLSHPAVQDAAVAGVQDEKWGERLVAWLVLDEATGVAAGDAELIAHLLRGLARFKVPREFVRVRAIPRTSAGKILRRALVENRAEERA